MRRAEFEIKNLEVIHQILDEVYHGVLGIQSDNEYPYTVPVNFVRIGEDIYFHGAKKGRKMECLVINPHVSFTVVRELAYIPSYFSDLELACPATQFFESVMAFGKAVVVNELEEKSSALQALMEKHQPEGRHLPLQADEAKYATMLEATAVVRIDVDKISGKAKLGQHLKPDKHQNIFSQLQQRDGSTDRATLQRMEKYKEQ